MVGIVAGATLTLPTRVVNGLESPRSLLTVHLFQSVLLFLLSLRLIQDGAAANVRKRARLMCGTAEFHFLSRMTRPCWLRAFVSNVKQS